MSTSTLVSTKLRPELDDFSSIICFKALAHGLEEALGEKAALIATIAAGRVRGKKLAADLGLAGSKPVLSKAADLMRAALGPDGTRLCLIDKIEAVEDGYRVYCRETICSAGEPQGSARTMSFTLGAVQGALEAMMGLRLRGTQVESVLRGSSHDVVELKVLA